MQKPRWSQRRCRDHDELDVHLADEHAPRLMAGIKVFRIGTYVPTQRGHFAPKLETTAKSILFGDTHGTTLWGTKHDQGEDEIPLALAHPSNLKVLRLLCGQPRAQIKWCVRGLGGFGDIDLVALIHDPAEPRPTLLLVDCYPAGHTRGSKLREQYVQALRVSRSVLASITLADPQPDTSLVLLTAWRPGMALPSTPYPPQWEDSAVPQPLWWGFVPFGIDQTEYVALGPWQQLDGEPRLRDVQRRNADYFYHQLPKLPVTERPLRHIEYPIDLGPGSALEFWLDRGPFRARLRVPAAKHKRALAKPGKDDRQAGRVRRIREASYEGRWLPSGWRFLGENIEHGCPWLGWQWTESDGSSRMGWTTAQSQADQFAKAMTNFILAR